MAAADQQSVNIREMYLLHTMFRREFALLPALVRGVAAGDTERAHVVADHVVVVRAVLDHHHHCEDKHLWPRLLERGTAEAVLAACLMEDQHAAIDRILAKITTSMRAWRADADPGLREALAGEFDQLASALIEHMAMEEDRALSLIELYITAAEWNAMVAEGAPDVRIEDLPLVLGMLMYEAGEELVDEILSNMPTVIKPGIRKLAAHAFAAHSVRIHGTPAPPRSKA